MGIDGATTPRTEAETQTSATVTGHPPRMAITRSKGTLVGRFVLLERLGDGGSGTVYSAFDPMLDRQVAIKLVHPVADDLEAASIHRARVVREAQAMARIKHPNVVAIYDVGVTEDEDVFLAVEKIEGGTLADWLSESRPWRDVLRVLCAAGDGLGAAHAVGVIHRDFKPANVLMDGGRVPRVTDFGLARTASATSATSVPPQPARATAPSDLVASATSLTDPLTQSAAALGTPGYMPPEQYGLGPIDERADVFAFCASLYRALYGQRPFAGDTVAEVANATLQGKVQTPPKTTHVPAWVERIVLRGLSMEPSARPGSMSELLALLRNDPTRARRRAAAVGAVVVALAGAAIAGSMALSRRARACDDAVAPIDAAWNPAQKARIARAFEDTGRSYAASAWRQVERGLDAYAAQWRSTAQASCAATRLRGEQSAAMLQQRTACLDEHLDEARALTDLLTNADAKVVETAPRAVRELSPLDVCSDVDKLGGWLTRPRSAEAQAEIRALQGELARGKELHDAGKKKQSFEVIKAVEARVERAGWPPLIVTMRNRLAGSEKHLDEKAAVADYEEAIALAERLRLDEQKAAAEINLGSFEGSWLGRPTEAHVWMRMADAAIARAGGNPRLEVVRDEEEAWVYDYENKLPLAATLFRRVLDRAPALKLDEPDTIAGAHSGLGHALAEDGKMDLALEQAELALRSMIDAYGRDHPWVAGYLNNLAVAQLADGQVDDALASATGARDMIAEETRRGDSAAASSDYALALHTRGEVLLRAGRFDEAAAELTRARDGYRVVHEGPHPDIAYADNELAEALHALGRRSEAAGAIEEARSIEQAAEAPPLVVSGTLLATARAELERGALDAASADAEKALAKLRENDARGADLAKGQLVTAQVLLRRGTEKDRARDLATKARDVFARLHDDAWRDAASAVLHGLE